MNHLEKVTNLLDSKDITICVIGLGYVGLPLAVEFGKKFRTLGFDINEDRLHELNKSIDMTLEVSTEEIEKSSYIEFTSNNEKIKEADVFIITVPTPITLKNEPDMKPLHSASELIGNAISQGSVVIYESTVYPGATEEYCVPLIEKNSMLKFNEDFFVGYSPERINPGDKEHNLTSILKVTSGSNPETAVFVDKLYKSIITAGTYMAPSIKVAEAAKVIENTQRDVNIGLINELSIIFKNLDIDTEEVLKAAGTKWNFLNFRPGLVGGHCIGVDPYYLTHKAQEIGINPEMILAGRKINDSMGKLVSETLINALKANGIAIKDSKVLIMGLTFKEDCPDIRNSKVFDIIETLHENQILVDVYDPWLDAKNMKNKQINLLSKIEEDNYDGIILAVAHKKFKEMGIKKIKNFGKEESIIFDLKYLFSADETSIRL